jgi:hypothetical protein
VQQLVNFALFVVSIGAFEFFLRSWLRSAEEVRPDLRKEAAYAILFLGTAFWLPAWYGGPDELVSIFLFFTAGFALRHIAPDASGRTRVMLALGLGASCGLGYLSKTIFFPIVLAVFALECVYFFRGKIGIAPLLAFTLAVSIFSAPFVLALRLTEGHWTFGDTGKLNYIWFVSPCRGKIAPVPWLEQCEGAGEAIHPPAKLMDAPHISYTGGVFPGATESFWYNPSYWQAGLRMTFSLAAQYYAFKKCTWYLIKHVIAPLAALLFAVALIGNRGKVKYAAHHGAAFALSPPALIGFTGLALYAIFMRADAAFLATRYLAGFATLLLVAALFASNVERLPSAFFEAIRGALIACCITAAVYSIGKWEPYWQRFWSPYARSTVATLAKNVRAKGLAPGNAIAICLGGLEPISVSQIARLDGLHITAIVDESFFKKNFDNRFEVYRRLRERGIEAILSWVPPAKRRMLVAEKWEPLGEMGVYILRLEQNAAGEARPGELRPT